MRSLGDKISSTIVAQSARVPTMPWSGDGLMVDTTQNHHDDSKMKTVVRVDDALFHQACIDTVEQGLQEARRIGYPIMIKVRAHHCPPR